MDHPNDDQTATRALVDRPRNLFVRPNLKLFGLGAICILVVHALISDGRSASARSFAWHGTPGKPLDLEQLLIEARRYPCSEVFIQISRQYEKLKDYRRALGYLRIAEDAPSAAEL